MFSPTKYPCHTKLYTPHTLLPNFPIPPQTPQHNIFPDVCSVRTTPPLLPSSRHHLLHLAAFPVFYAPLLTPLPSPPPSHLVHPALFLSHTPRQYTPVPVPLSYNPLLHIDTT